MEKIFVYGTLRMGSTANHLLRNARAVQTGLSLKGFAMYSYGPYPFVIPSSHPQDFIIGDLYEIQEDQLKILDEYEGGEYKRAIIPELKCYIYLKKDGKPENYPKITNGNWLQ
jgi:gamma-glutamylcyclotransferase (GGCT)/AIG2-like uncharacterized protein YtfP